MAERTHDRPTLRDLFRVGFRHKKKMVFVAGATLAAVAAGLVLTPRSYESEAKLFIRAGRESVGVDPTIGSGATLSVYETRESEINSALEILRSRALVEQVVDELGPDAVLGPVGSTDSGWRSTLRAWLPGAGGADAPAVSRREKAIADLEDCLEFWSPKRSAVIGIRCEAASPELAQRIVATLLAAYEREHSRLNAAPGSHEFFAEQAALTEARLERAAAALRDAKNAAGVASVDGERALLEGRVAAVEAELARAETSLEAAQARAEVLKRQRETVPEFLVSQETSGFPNVAADAMRADLYRLEIEERELLAKYTEEHPLVVAIREQVASARRIVEQQDTERTQTTRAVNPVYQALESDLLAEEARVVGLASEAEALRSEVAALRERVETLNAEEIRIAQLGRDVELLQASYHDYVEKREQTRVGEALTQQGLSNVSVLQPASYVARPVSPRTPLILALGVFVALLGAVATAVLAEALDHTLKTPSQIEDALGLPVLMSVPRTSRRHVLLN